MNLPQHRKRITTEAVQPETCRSPSTMTQWWKVPQPAGLRSFSLMDLLQMLRTQQKSRWSRWSSDIMSEGAAAAPHTAVTSSNSSFCTFGRK